MAIAAMRVFLKLEGGLQHERTVRLGVAVAGHQDTAQADAARSRNKSAQRGNRRSRTARAVRALRTAHSTASFCRKRRSRDRPPSCWARLRKLLGEDRVGSPELVDDHRPNAFRMASFEPAASSAARAERKPLSVPVSLRVHRPPPQLVTVQLVNERPACGCTGMRRLTVSASWPGRNASVGIGGRRLTGAAKSGTRASQ